MVITIRNRIIGSAFLFLCFFSHPILFGQSDFHEITKFKNKVSTLSKGQQLTKKWPIPELKKTFRTIVVDSRGMFSMDVNEFIDDMNSNSRITMLKIETRFSDNVAPTKIQSIPLSKLKYVKHLAFVRTSYKDKPISDFINWDEIVSMQSLKYLYLQPFTSIGFSGKEINIPLKVKKALATKLEGYVNYGYNGEFDNIAVGFNSLGIIVHPRQQNQPLRILRNCKDAGTSI